MKRLSALLDEGLPVGQDWHKTLVERLAGPVEGRRPAVLDRERLVLAVYARRVFRHVAIHADDRFDDGGAALAVASVGVFLDEVGPALARFHAAIDPD